MPALLESSADGDFGKKSVTALQKFLNQEGFYCGAEDGDWGGTTEKALQLFLKDEGYDVDFKKPSRRVRRPSNLFCGTRIPLRIPKGYPFIPPGY